MPSTRPRITFDKLGVCNACKYKKKKKKINVKKRKNELENILNKYRSKTTDHDCIVPWSGGKDSSYVAYQLKFKYKMNPLLVTFSPIIPSSVGHHNRNELIKLGFDHIMFKPNEKTSSYLSKRFLIERGNPKVAWDAGVNAVPIKVAMEKKIKLIFYAEHGESHYGGKILSEKSEMLRNLDEILEHQIGDDPINWLDHKITKKDIIPYLMPNKKQLEKNNIQAYYFAYFDDWNVKKNYEFIKNKINFKNHEENRSPGTFTNYDSLDDHIDSIYYHLQYLKFGFGRCWRDASRHIQLNEINKIDAMKLIEKYDDEINNKDLMKTLNFLKLSRIEFFDIVEKHRNNEIWGKKGNKFKLIKEIK
tara:strand:- start:286 stop:1368 length:1083 start_codon:yes stop_codon:yes gene_type:complete